MRRVPIVVLVSLFLILAGCVSAGGFAATGTPAGESTQATVIDVVDGDTLELKLGSGAEETVRLLGVDTPEVHTSNEPGEYEGVPATAAGQECLRAAGHTATAFMQQRVLDETVTIAFDPLADRRGAYGRLLAYVQLNGRDVNRLLIRKGHARVYDSTFARAERYYELESAAQSDRRGLWRCRGPGETTNETNSLRLVLIHADAAGDDRENPNDEYLVFENDGTEPMALGNWTLSDAAGHTITFPSGFSLAPDARVTVYTGDGTGNDTALYWGAGGAVWNNDGDTVILSAANGTVVLERSYG